jgi:hypothetical protein
MVPVADDLSLAAERAVHRQRQSDGEPVDAAARTACLVSLDDEVPVVLLDRKMDHPKAIEGRSGDGAADRSENLRRAQRREPSRCSNGHLHGIARVDPGPRDVRH